MPLWSGNVMAGRGGGACISRLCASPGASSCHRKRRVDLGLALHRFGVVQSAQTWSAATTFQCSGGRSLSNWRAMAEEQEQVEQNRAISHAETELLDANEASSVVVATGSIFGAVALITGTSVGAGILALPAITAPIGFIPTATTMCISWAFLLLEALLLAEVNVALMRRREILEKELTPSHSQVLSLRTMAEETMGPVGAWVTTLIYLMLSYTLLVAYISKSGEVLALLMEAPQQRAAADVVFTVGLGGLLCGGGAKMADNVNQVLTVVLLGLFLLIVFGGAKMADWTGLEHVDWTHTPQTLPIIFLALVYHDLTPVNTILGFFVAFPIFVHAIFSILEDSLGITVVCAQLGGDIGRIRISILLGSFVPLLMFLSWDAVALCITPLLGAKDPIDVFMRVGGPGPAFVVEAFAFLAVATSFIGTVLGLQEFFLEQWGEAQGMITLKQLSTQGQATRPLFEWLHSKGPRAITSLLVLAPPLVASSLVSDAFFSASDLAGAYGMTSLYGVIPPIMAWGLQNSSLSSPVTKSEHKNSVIMSVLGDRITLATVGACAVAVIVGQVMIDVPQFSSSSAVVVANVDQKENQNPTSKAFSQPFTTLAAP